MNMKLGKFILAVLLGAVLSSEVSIGQAARDAPKQQAATPSNVEVQTLKLTSKQMNREMPYRVILPVGYSEAKAAADRYPVIYLLHGLTGHYDNWIDKTKLAEYSTAYKFIIVTPEGGDGWYTDSISAPNDKYESYLVKELVPELDRKFRTIADRTGRAIAGLSMGGYGAIKFGLKYPELFTLAGSFSGALAVTATLPATRDTGFVRSVTAIFGPPDSDTRKANNLFKILSEMPDTAKTNLPFLYIDCGTEDFLFKSNRNFIALLLEEKISHEYRQRPGGHTWTYWDAQVQEFLKVSERHLKK